MMILTGYYSLEIETSLSNIRDVLNDSDELSDAQNLYRIFLNHWVGISLALNILFLSLMKKFVTTFNNVINKITK